MTLCFSKPILPVVIAAFDTHSSVKTLTASGMPEAQAEAVTSLLQQSRDRELSTLATKADVAGAEAALQHEVAQTKAALQREVEKVGSDLAQAKADFLRALAETKTDILKWVIGMVAGAIVFNAVTVVGAVLALIRVVGR